MSSDSSLLPPHSRIKNPNQASGSSRRSNYPKLEWICDTGLTAEEHVMYDRENLDASSGLVEPLAWMNTTQNGQMLLSEQTAPSPQTFPVQDLVPELRKMIYTFAVATTEELVNPRQPALSWTSKQVRKEVLECFYQVNIFSVKINRLRDIPEILFYRERRDPGLMGVLGPELLIPGVHIDPRTYCNLESVGKSNVSGIRKLHIVLAQYSNAFLREQLELMIQFHHGAPTTLEILGTHSLVKRMRDNILEEWDGIKDAEGKLPSIHLEDNERDLKDRLQTLKDMILGFLSSSLGVEEGGGSHLSLSGLLDFGDRLFDDERMMALFTNKPALRVWIRGRRGLDG